MPGLNLLFVLLLFVGAVSTRDDPDFSKNPQDVTVIQGQSVTLPCEITPDAGMTVYWELNGSKITNTTRRYQQGSNLHITRVDRERDSGQFLCITMGQVGGGSIKTSGASLNIQWIGDVEVQLQEPEDAAIISAGKDVVLRCHVDASGDVHFEWFRNLDRLAKSDRIEIKKKRLRIKDVQPSDNGVYRCTATNEAGSKRSVKSFALAVPGDQTSLIEIVPSNQLVSKGGIAFIDCKYKHADVIEWYFQDSGPLETNHRITVHSNGTLQINDVKESDQGYYNCVGVRSESAELPQSYTAELKLAYINNFAVSSFEPELPEDSKYIVAENNPFQLTCLEPESRPLAKKWWLNTNGHIISDAGVIRVDDDGRLIIDEIKYENTGNYTCVAENIAGKTERTILLIVTTKPTITSHPENVLVDENHESSLHCAYDSKSSDYIQIRWLKDKKVVSESQKIKVFDNGTLWINSTQISDRGEYICEVLQRGFEPIKSKPAVISVIESLKFTPPPVNKQLELGTMSKVHCKAQGSPPPIIKWEKNGVPSEQFKSHITDINGTLHFNVVLADDNGTYSCIASNSQGVINATINIDVGVAPKFIQNLQNPLEVNEGQAILIDCVVDGVPKPTIQWDKNLKMHHFDPSRFTVFDNGSLYISEVHQEDENKYGCTAGNSAGLNRKDFQLIVHSTDGFHPDGDTTVTKAVLITMSVAGAYIILVIGLMVWCRYRRRSRKLPMGDVGKTENGDVDHTELKDGTNGHCSGVSKVENGLDALKEGQKSDGAETTHSQSSNNSKKSKSNYDKLVINRSHLKELKLIGRGEFGDVMAGKISKIAIIDQRNSQVNISSDEKDLIVLVKALTQTKEENCLAEFKREIDIFLKLSHENVTKIYGLCRESEPHYMILEHTDWGDLKQFLVATAKGISPALTPVQNVAILHQLSRGMEHFAANRLIHRDLAARNCLVSSTLAVKIGMPRLTRDPYSQEYCKHLNQVIPLRWLPYEAVYEDEYSTKSDIYSFGVVILEVFNQGELPFPKMNDNSFISKLKEKKLEWKAHSSTPENLQKLQKRCLEINPQTRPSFSETTKEIEEILKSM